MPKQTSGFRNPSIQKRLLWIIDGSLKAQLHRNARIKPAVELSKIGWDVRLVTSEAPSGMDALPIKLHHVRWPKAYLFGAIWYYLSIVKQVLSGKLRTDVLFFQMDSMTLILLLIPMLQKFLPARRCRVVVDYRSLPMNLTSIKGKLRGLVFQLGTLFASAMDIHITAITSQLAEYLNIPRQKLIGIWPSGADRLDFADCLDNRRWPQPGGPIQFLYLGALTKERNIYSVIEAVRKARQQGLKAVLNIIGSGKDKDFLRAMLTVRDDGFIKIDGPLPYTQVAQLLSQNHVGILPFPNTPKMNVSSAIKMFEYMAAGMPIIATRIPAHENVFKGSPFVFWADEDVDALSAAIQAVFEKMERLPCLGKKAKHESANWSWESSARRLSEALMKVVIT